jgi:hypothetical protein
VLQFYVLLRRVWACMNHFWAFELIICKDDSHHTYTINCIFISCDLFVSSLVFLEAGLVLHVHTPETTVLRGEGVVVTYGSM